MPIRLLTLGGIGWQIRGSVTDCVKPESPQMARPHKAQGRLVNVYTPRRPFAQGSDQEMKQVRTLFPCQTRVIRVGGKADCLPSCYRVLKNVRMRIKVHCCQLTRKQYVRWKMTRIVIRNVNKLETEILFCEESLTSILLKYTEDKHIYNIRFF